MRDISNRNMDYVSIGSWTCTTSLSPSLQSESATCWECGGRSTHFLSPNVTFRSRLDLVGTDPTARSRLTHVLILESDSVYYLSLVTSEQ